MAAPAFPIRTGERNSPEAEKAYADAPEALKVELLRGIVCMAPAPVPEHQRQMLRVALRLMRKYDRTDGDGSGPGGWIFVSDPELHVGERPDRFKPDLAGWREKRVTFKARDTSITVAPDWVCEVLSPSTEVIDRGVKAPLYAEHGVEWLWVVGREARVLEVFHNERGAMRSLKTLRAEEAGALPPFEEASLAAFFDDAL